MAIKRKWFITLVQSDSAKSVNLSISKRLGTFAIASVLFVLLFILLSGVYFWNKNIQALQYDKVKQENVLLKKQIDKYSNQMDSVMIKIKLMEEWEDKIREEKKYKIIDKEVRSLGSGGLPYYNQTFSKYDPEFNKVFNERSKQLDYLVAKANLTFITHKELLLFTETQSMLFVSTPSILPTFGKVTDNFGYRMHPIFRYTRFHSGMDISNDKGTPVYATADGKIESAERDGSYGLMILIAHESGYETKYAHLSKILVNAGQDIKKGQIIGEMGNSGLSTGTHLHYEVIKDNVTVNPAHFLHLAESDIKVTT